MIKMIQKELKKEKGQIIIIENVTKIVIIKIVVLQKLNQIHMTIQQNSTMIQPL